MADTLFSRLLDHRFRDVSFPATMFRVRIRHDLAIHRPADKDGAEIEATGRAPLEFSARIPFINGIARGPNELWQEPLYPVAFRAFIDAVADRSTGTLNHPEFGPISVKTEHCEVVWDGTKQGGVEVDVTWLETVVNVLDAVTFLGSASPTHDIANAAAVLDQAIKNQTFTNPAYPDSVNRFLGKAQTSLGSGSFQDMANAIRAIADAPGLLNQQIGGKIDSIVASARTIATAIGDAANPVLWPITTATTRIVSAARDLRQTVLQSRRTIALYPVKKDSTMGQISADSGAPMSDLFVLNPLLLRAPVVPAGSTVRYYASAA